MTVPLYTPAQFTGDGVTTVFPFTFEIDDGEDLVKTYNPATFVETVLVNGVDYSMSGTGNPAGGTITVSPALAVSIVVTIERSPPLVQELDLNPQSNYDPTSLEAAFDVTVEMIQKLSSDQADMLRVPLGSSVTPASLVTALLAYTAAGFVSVPTQTDVNDLGQALLRWRSVYLSGTGKIDAGNGSVILQYSAGVATYSVGVLRVTSAGNTNAGDVVTRGGTQTLTNKTLTTPIISQPIINGVTDGSSASAGVVGESIESDVAVGAAVALTTNVTANVTSITLTNGDWEVWGSVGYSCVSTASFTRVFASISQTTGTANLNNGMWAATTMNATVPPVGVVGSAFNESIGPVRISVTGGSVSVFLVAQTQFTVAPVSAYGHLKARRVR